MNTAVVILNWNGVNFLEKFLEKVVSSIKNCNGSEVIIADNGSTDGSVEYIKNNFPKIKLITLDKNYGFTGGYNRALAQIEAKYFLLLNSDIEVTDNWLYELENYMDANHNVAACAPKILAYHNKSQFEYAGASGGFIDKYGYPFCRGRILDYLEHDNGQYNSIIKVFWATGAALMVRAHLYKKAGGLNEAFFAHMEELDLCWRLQRMGYDIASVPQSIVYHVGGGMLPKESPRKLFLNFRNNLMMLACNLPSRKIYIIFLRLILDGVSGLMYLLSGKPSYTLSVIKAHWLFFAKIPYCISYRRTFKPLATCEAHSGIYKGSIVARYFKSGKKLKFSELQQFNN